MLCTDIVTYFLTVFYLCIFSEKQILWSESKSWAKAVRWLCVARLQLVKQLYWNNYCTPIMLQVYCLPVHIWLFTCFWCTAYIVYTLIVKIMLQIYYFNYSIGKLQYIVNSLMKITHDISFHKACFLLLLFLQLDIFLVSEIHQP